MVRLIDMQTDICVPVIYRHISVRSNFIWVGGVNKKILKEYGLEVKSCRMVSLSFWIYLVNRLELENFLNRNNLPLLEFRLGA